MLFFSVDLHSSQDTPVSFLKMRKEIFFAFFLFLDRIGSFSMQSTVKKLKKFKKFKKLKKFKKFKKLNRATCINLNSVCKLKKLRFVRGLETEKKIVNLD